MVVNNHQMWYFKEEESGEGQEWMTGELETRPQNTFLLKPFCYPLLIGDCGGGDAINYRD